MWFVELVGVLIWPALVFYVFRTYQAEIASMFGRLKSASAFGVTISSDDQQQVSEDAAEPDDNLKDLMAIPDTPLVLEFEENIKEMLGQRNQTIESPLETMLLRNFVDVSLRLDFELIYKHIYASQIRLLKVANTRGDLSKEYVAAHFENCKSYATYPNEWGVDDYTAFLIRSVLLREENEALGLTVKGQEFLVWLARTGNPEAPNDL